MPTCENIVIYKGCTLNHAINTGNQKYDTETAVK